MNSWGSENGAGSAWPSRAQRLLLRAALVRDERGLEAWANVRPELDVERLDGPVQAVLPHLRANLLALGVDDELLTLFKGVHRYVWAQNQLLLARLMPVVGVLERTGIRTLLLKGAGLVAGSRLDAGMRPMQDIDVLVPTSRLQDAVAVLFREGLTAVSSVPGWYVSEYAPQFTPSYAFESPDGHQLDLHWHALHISCQPDADDEFWAAARPVELHGVATRALCAADELLLVISHGLRWNRVPTYRWVVDAALIARGESGEVDWDRLVAQARRRHVVGMVRVGLRYLRREVGAPVPASALRTLYRSRTGAVERGELRAQLRAPRDRGALAQAVLRHQQLARRRLPLGARPSLTRRVRLLREQRGIGPGRPMSEVDAPIGTGSVDRSAPAVSFGEFFDFADDERIRQYFLYGAWRPEPGGCWLAGPESALVLPLAQPASGSLLLGISADAPLSHLTGLTQRLEVLAGRTPVGGFVLEPARPHFRDEAVVLPREAVMGRSTLELTLRTPDAISLLELGLHDADDRALGVLLRSLVLREPAAVRIGDAVGIGEELVAGGWGAGEPGGRWTLGGQARLLMRVSRNGDCRPRALEIDGEPLRNRQRVSVEIAGAVSEYVWDGAGVQRVALTSEAIVDGELLVTLHVDEPLSPAALGLSDDWRPLGLLVRSVRVVE